MIDKYYFNINTLLYKKYSKSYDLQYEEYQRLLKDRANLVYEKSIEEINKPEVIESENSLVNFSRKSSDNSNSEKEDVVEDLIVREGNRKYSVKPFNQPHPLIQSTPNIPSSTTNNISKFMPETTPVMSDRPTSIPSLRLDGVNSPSNYSPAKNASRSGTKLVKVKTNKNIINVVIDNFRVSYYQAHVSRLSFLMYDFNSKKLVQVLEPTPYNCNNQLEKKMSEIDEYYINGQNNKRNSPRKDYRPKDKALHNNYSNQSNDKQDDDVDVQDSDEFHQFIKQIKYAMNREENQPAITNWKIIMGFIWIFSLFFIVTNFTLMVTAIDIIKLNLTLFEDSLKIQTNFVIGNYYIRELTLLNIPEYKDYYGNAYKDVYYKNLTNDLDILYNNTKTMDKIIGKYDIGLSAENNYTLFGEKKPLFIIQSDFIQRVETTLKASRLEVSTSMYKVASMNQNQVSLSNNFVFLFIYNTLNDFFSNNWINSYVYQNELKTQINDSLTINIVVLSFSIVVFLAGYSLSIITYTKVMEKKESYISVFFEIDNSIIFDNLKKCEKFLKYISVSVVFKYIIIIIVTLL